LRRRSSSRFPAQCLSTPISVLRGSRTTGDKFFFYFFIFPIVARSREPTAKQVRAAGCEAFN
jgi:hypothetical protein